MTEDPTNNVVDQKVITKLPANLTKKIKKQPMLLKTKKLYVDNVILLCLKSKVDPKNKILLEFRRQFNFIIKIAIVLINIETHILDCRSSHNNM